MNMPLTQLFLALQGLSPQGIKTLSTDPLTAEGADDLLLSFSAQLQALETDTAAPEIALQGLAVHQDLPPDGKILPATLPLGEGEAERAQALHDALVLLSPLGTWSDEMAASLGPLLNPSEQPLAAGLVDAPDQPLRLHDTLTPLINGQTVLNSPEVPLTDSRPLSYLALGESEARPGNKNVSLMDLGKALLAAQQANQATTQAQSLPAATDADGLLKQPVREGVSLAATPLITTETPAQASKAAMMDFSKMMLTANLSSQTDADGQRDPQERPQGNMILRFNELAVLSQAANVNAQQTSTLSTPSSVPVFQLNTPLQQQALWGEQMGQRLMWMVNQGMQSAELRMNPPELGPIEIRIRMDQDQRAHIQFTASHSLTREAIDASMPRLREMFAEGGVALGDVNVSDQGADQADRQERDRGNGLAAEASGGTPEEGHTPRPTVHIAQGLVDAYV